MMQACIAAFAPDPLEFMIEFLTKEIEGRRSLRTQDRGNTRWERKQICTRK